jgi:hypothetical protein
VFVNLTGTTTARSVLEAMITHSDNTATDITLAATGPDQVRALIAEAGLTKTQIPDSTRRLVSYLIGAPEGVDIGWAGVQRFAKGETFGEPRPAINDRQTMASTAEEMVRWYQQALAGAFFKRPQTLVEFKRIQAMADALAPSVPPDTVAYGKGGSLDIEGFHALCLAGQMIVAGVPITFCTTINWTGGDDSVAPTFHALCRRRRRRAPGGGARRRLAPLVGGPKSRTAKRARFREGSPMGPAQRGGGHPSPKPLRGFGPPTRGGLATLSAPPVPPHLSPGPGLALAEDAEWLRDPNA